jgi:hypothetical protein
MHFRCHPVDASFFDTAPMRCKNVVELAPGLPMSLRSSRTENPGPDGFTAYARWFGPAISPTV